MSVAKTLQGYFEARDLNPAILHHGHTSCSSETAEVAHVPGRQLAKGVVLRSRSGEYLLVVIPSTRHLAFDRICELYGSHLELADERDLKALFPDCELGAVPALGMAYRLSTYVDEALFDEPKVYFEGGDHESLVRMSSEAFAAQFDESAIGEFSAPPLH